MSWEILAGSTAVLTAIGALLMSVWGLRGWFSNQFLKIYERMDKLETNVLTKLEYHEKHDDERFSQITTQMWEMRLASALNKNETLKKENLISRTPGTESFS